MKNQTFVYAIALLLLAALTIPLFMHEETVFEIEYRSTTFTIVVEKPLVVNYNSRLCVSGGSMSNVCEAFPLPKTNQSSRTLFLKKDGFTVGKIFLYPDGSWNALEVSP